MDAATTLGDYAMNTHSTVSFPNQDAYYKMIIA